MRHEVRTPRGQAEPSLRGRPANGSCRVAPLGWGRRDVQNVQQTLDGLSLSQAVPGELLAVAAKATAAASALRFSALPCPEQPVSTMSGPTSHASAGRRR
jgi:hypothetical protein